MSNLINIVNIYKLYGNGERQVKALNGVNLNINEGEFVAIVGSSGSGKSTLMNIIGCLDLPTKGKYYINGSEVSNLCDNSLSFIRNRKIGFIFQGFNLIPGLNALENVELPLYYRNMPKINRTKCALEALEKVGLSSRIYHLPSEMSGGQQQRVAIARAIAAKPPIILADEPTGNLDSASGNEIINILKELWLEGKTVILITHDSEIANQCMRIIQISDGKIISDFKREENIVS